jgi:hypothetical protein
VTKAKETKLIESDKKAIAHLRGQHQRKRLGLVFGAGISKDLDFPNWETLVSRIAARPEVNATSILERLTAERADAKASHAIPFISNADAVWPVSRSTTSFA